MKNVQLPLWSSEEYRYPMAQGFVPNIMAYLHEDKRIHPCMVIVPGGAYCFISPSEGELPAKKFYGYGYNVFVLTYTINATYDYPLLDQPLKDLSRAIRYVRANQEEFCVDPEKLGICGFSAGGHLCACMCVHYSDISDENPDYQNISNKPNAAVLSYPVITSGKYAHQGSFDALLGLDAPEELRLYYSPEKHVRNDTPPCFIWTTVNDETVPAENSVLFAQALKEKNIPHALHVFSEGRHGLSTADQAYAEGRFGEPYTIIQTLRITEGVKNGTIQVSDEVRQMMEFYEAQGISKTEANEEASMWTEMARIWLAKYM